MKVPPTVKEEAHCELVGSKIKGRRNLPGSYRKHTLFRGRGKGRLLMYPSSLNDRLNKSFNKSFNNSFNNSINNMVT